MRIMLDSNVFDKLLADPDALQRVIWLEESGRSVLVSTHVQRDQLAATPQPKRSLLLGLGLEFEEVPTSGAVWGVSKWDEATWDDGVGDVKLSDVISDKGNHIEDALIATTAAAHCEVLVTDEKKRLPNRIKTTGSKLIVWNFEEFVTWAKDQSPD